MQSKKIVDGVNGAISSGNVPSQTCTIPMAAVPSVSLDVSGKVNFDSAYEFKTGNLTVDPEDGKNYIYVDGEAPQVTATIGIDKSKIWDASEGTGIRGVSEGSTIGAIALVITDKDGDEGKPVEADFDSLEFKVKDGTEFAIDSNGGTLPVNSASATGEGTYKVYAVNRRNHTYNISDASEVIHVSKVAPVLSSIDLIARKENGETADIEVLEDNIAFGDNVNIYGDITSRTFEATINDSLDDAVTVILRAVEVNKRGEIEPLGEDYDEGEETLPNVYEATLVEGTSNVYEFTIAEGGRFVIEAVTKYHGTQCVTITDPFVILAQ